MSLYQIVTMLRELEKRREKDKPKQVSDAEWEQAEQMILSVTLNDPSVRI
jgi:hypothetical protein